MAEAEGEGGTAAGDVAVERMKAEQTQGDINSIAVPAIVEAAEKGRRWSCNWTEGSSNWTDCFDLTGNQFVN